jgi:hypothetical protein
MGPHGKLAKEEISLHCRVHITDEWIFILLSCDFYIPTVAWKSTNKVTVMGIVTEVFVL